MTEISETRHTFKFLDAMLPADSVSTVDHFFKELDVSTAMVENNVGYVAARAGYYTLRGVAMTVQIVVFAIFIPIKYTALGIYYGVKWSVKAVIVLVVDMPIEVQKSLFPSKADIYENTVTTAKKALKEGAFEAEHVLGPQEKKHSGATQKALMRSLLVQPILSQPDCKPEWKECCTLLHQLADGDLSAEELKVKESQVRAIIKKDQEGKNELAVPHLVLLADTFIDVFKKERELESSLRADEIASDPLLLLRYPRLLLRKDVEGVVNSAPEELKRQLLMKQAAVRQKLLKQIHEKEMEQLNNLATLLPQIDLDLLEETYLSPEEGQFLEKRQALLEKRIGQLEDQKKNEGFEYLLLTFEQQYLVKQAEKMRTSQLATNFLNENDEKVKELNTLHLKSREDLCDALKSRIQTTLNTTYANTHSGKMRQLEGLRQDLEKGLKALEENESEEPFETLKSMVSQLHALETLMVTVRLSREFDWDALQKGLVKTEHMRKQISLAHEIHEWEAFTTLTTPQQRTEERQNELARDFLNMLLETKAECQVPLLLTKQDARSHHPSDVPVTTEKGSYRKIIEASQSFVDAMRDRYLEAVKTRLYSLTEFTSDIQAGENFGIFGTNQTLKETEEKEIGDFRTIGMTLQTAEALSKWYTKLQEIWLEHMPLEQEKLLNSLWGSKEAKMSECFGRWFEMTTGKKLDVQLRFDHLTVPDRSEERQASVGFLKEYLQKESSGFPALVRRTQERVTTLRAPTPTKAQGFDPDLLAQPVGPSSLTVTQYNPSYFDEIRADSQQFEDIVTALVRIRSQLGNVIAGREIEWQTNWVVALNDFIRSSHSKSLQLHLQAACKSVIALCCANKRAVPEQVKNVYIDLYSTTDLRAEKKFNFETMNNEERSDFLTHFVMILSASGTAIMLPEDQQIRLHQLLALSSLPKQDQARIQSLVTTSPLNPPVNHLLHRVSRDLQASPVGLEGVDAEIVRQSIKESGLPISGDTRGILDSHTTMGTKALSFSLLPYIYSRHGKNLSHYQGREAIARAIVHAHSQYPLETRAYVLQKISDHAGKLEVNPQTLAPPLYIFYCDILRQIDPETYFKSQTITDNVGKFNLSLAAVTDANLLLMGFSRIIADISFAIEYKQSKGEVIEADVLALLRYKIAYQSIRKNYFENKVQVTGFLKIETDLAESALLKVDSFARDYLKDPAHQQTIINTLKAWIADGNDPTEQCVSRELKCFREEPIFKATELPSFFKLSPRVMIDVTTGIIYNDGQQRIHLPAHLQNHPHVHVLGIRNFPYIWDVASNRFVYYTEGDGGRSEPYLFVKEIDKKPVIFKKLNTDFKASHLAFLKFVPKEDVQLPMAFLHRMNIEQLWQSRDGRLFGYDKDGQLIAIFNRFDSTVETADGKYVFLTEEQKSLGEQHPVLKLLSKNFNLNEVLINSELTTFYIPALELKLTKRIQIEKDAPEEWICNIKGMSEKILDLTSNSALLTLKNVVNPRQLHGTQRRLKEAIYRRDLYRIKDPSVTEAYELKKLKQAVTQQQNRLLALEEPLFMTTTADAAYRIEDVAQILEILPVANHVRQNFTRRLERRDYYPNEIFPLALKYLTGLIDQENKKGTSQKEINPLLTAYVAIQKRCETICDRPLEPVFFDRAVDGSARTKDLTSALTLVVNQLEQEEPDFSFLMNEFSKYPLEGSMNPSQLALLTRAIGMIGTATPRDFKAYLYLLRYHHFLYRVRELAVTPLSDKQGIVEDVQDKLDISLRECKDSIASLDVSKSLKPALAILWRRVGLHLDHPLLKEAEPKRADLEKKVSRSFANELQVLRSKGLLERLSEKQVVEFTPKSAENELSVHQKELTTTFKSTSLSQVSGFYLEKMGYFSGLELCSEFRVDDKGRALFGLRKENVDEIFQFLKEEKLIEAVHSIPNFYRLRTPDCAEKNFPSNKLRALLAVLPISSQDMQKTMDRVQAFLFRAMQSGFEFSFVEGAEETFDKKLSQEKQIHLQKYLEAEDLLKLELVQYGASLVDLKYAYLTGDFGKFLNLFEDNDREIGRLTNALTRYLFHKTEVQHIENIQQAPAKGERNKIQLLQTKRNYSVDLLLQEGLTGAQRKEQIMQRAYLAFEEDYGNRCNLMQIRMFRALMVGHTSIDGIDAIQARMGFGKTALLILLAVVRVALERTEKIEDRQLVRYIVPRAVLEDNTSFFNQRLSSILGKKVVQDREFARYQIDKENPGTSFKMIIIDLKARLHFYEETRKHGNMLIQPPEIRCSMEAQDLDFAEMLRSETLDPATRDLCMEAKRLLVKIRSISTYNVFDELDDTQDFKSREVNFTRGAKLPIPTDTIRPLEQLVSYIEQNKNKDWSNKKERAREMILDLCKDRDGKRIVHCPDEVLDYVSKTGVEINEETKKLLSEPVARDVTDPQVKQTENDAFFFLIRMVLLDDYILSLIRSKQPRTHYGIRFSIDPTTGERQYSADPDTKSALLISVPYEGTDTPKGLSVYDNREVAAVTTIRFYLSNETSFQIHPHLNFLINQMRQDAIPPLLANHYLKGRGGNEHPALTTLRKMSGMLDPHELRIAKEAFFHEYMENPTKEFRKFFAMAVVATQIRSDEGCAKSDRYEQGSPDDINLGCSGTVGGTSSYFTRQAPDPAADGMLSIEIMGRDNNSVIEWLTPPQPEEDYLQAVIKTLLDHTKPNTRAIADIAGICKSRDGTPERVVEELWTQLQTREQFADIEGIIYYGKDNIKRLYRPGKAPIPCNTEIELAALQEGTKYFSFYKQKSCRGSDIKQAHGAHKLVTMDENVNNSDAKQTILRFRPIVTMDSGQSFSFVAMPEYGQIVKNALKAEKTKVLESVNKEIIEKNTAITAKETEILADKKNRQLRTEHKTLIEQRTALQGRQRALVELIKKIDPLTLEAKHIAYYLRMEEKSEEEENALTIFKKEMKAHIKVAAGHLEADILSRLPAEMTPLQKDAYVAFLKARDRISPLIERSLESLYRKYGLSTKEMSRDDFIVLMRKEANQALEALFKEAATFAQACDLELETEAKIYEKRMNRSVKTFKQRYSESKTVQVVGTRSDGQNVAQAQAQAQALAEAEALSETITQSIVQSQGRLWSPNLVMTKQPRETASFDFLANAALQQEVALIPGLSDTIHPDLRKDFKVSPGLLKKKEVSHYALLSHQTQHYMFISFEEAEAFKKEKENQASRQSIFNEFTLVDLRGAGQSVDGQPLPQNPETAQLPCVALSDNGVPKDHRLIKTENLRTLSLTNVKSDQLLPHLKLTHTNAVSQGLIQPIAFGVSQNATFSVGLKPTPEMLKIEIVSLAGKMESASLLLKNELFTKTVEEVFPVAGYQRKAEEVYRRIDEECKRVMPRLAELEEKKKDLDRLNAANQRVIAGVQNFNLSPKMIAGLQQRDNDYRGQALGTIGADAIRICDAISRLQEKLQRELSLSTLKELQQKFADFLSPASLQRAQQRHFNYERDFLLTKEEWSAGNNLNQVSILERVYGRIVHTVHASDISDAKGCSRDDCCNMFSQVIPSLLKVMPQLTQAVAEIEKNERARALIEKEIQELLNQYKPLLEARDCAKALVDSQRKIETLLAERGLHYAPGTFFDQFQFGKLSAIPQVPVTINVQGILPEYRLTVMQDMRDYQNAFRGLTEAESQNQTRNQDFLKHVLSLSAQVEDRSAEVSN